MSNGYRGFTSKEAYEAYYRNPKNIAAESDSMEAYTREAEAERYVPNGTPLTPYEDELLTILMEECAEVIVAASKLKRFGKENHPVDGMPNTEALAMEIGDVQTVMSMVAEAQLVDSSRVIFYLNRKRSRLAHFMQSKRG